MPNQAPQSRRFLRLPDVMARTGLGRATIYSLMAAGEFPRPRKLTSSANGWLEHELLEWIDSRPVNDAVGVECAGTES